ncbi:hypothetical protein N431DRAFT_457163 [Stipitochalara longipes BDJ]|nr:hypothetical protein N431DRAFT_457163 [Stipitochalara longipes BDJ]
MTGYYGNPDDGGDQPLDPESQRLIAELLNEDINGPTAGRPEQQQQYQELRYEVGGQTVNGNGRLVDQNQNQNQNRNALVGGRPPPATYRPEGGSMLDSNPLLDFFFNTPGNEFGGNNFPSFELGQQNLGMTGQPFDKGAPTGFDPNSLDGGNANPNTNPLLPGPSMTGDVFGQPSNQGIFSPTSFNPMLPNTQYANPFSNPPPQNNNQSPGSANLPQLNPSSGQPRSAPMQLPLIGFPRTQNRQYENGSTSGPLDPAQYEPDFPVPAAHEVLLYGTNDFPRQLQWYVDDGPQRIGETLEDYWIRSQRAITNMNLEIRRRPLQPANPNVADLREYERTVINQEITHRERLAQGEETFDADYVARWQHAKQAQHATNAERRIAAIDRLRRQYENYGYGNDFPSPPDAGYGDGDDNELYTHDDADHPLPRVAPAALPDAPAAGTTPRGNSKNKPRGPNAGGGNSSKRCEPCGSRNLACSMKTTGCPCTRCTEKGIEEQCVPRPLLPKGRKVGKKVGPYKKSAKQLEKETKKGGPKRKRTKGREEEAEEDNDEDEDEDETDEEEMPQLRSDSDSDEPSAPPPPPVASGPPPSARRNPPRRRKSPPPPDDEEPEEEEQPAKRRRTNVTRRPNTQTGAGPSRESTGGGSIANRTRSSAAAAPKTKMGSDAGVRRATSQGAPLNIIGRGRLSRPCSNCQRKQTSCKRTRWRPCRQCIDDGESDCDGTIIVQAHRDNLNKTEITRRRRGQDMPRHDYTPPAPVPVGDTEMMDVDEPSLRDLVDHQETFVPNSTAEEVLDRESGGWMGNREPSNADVEDHYQHPGEMLDPYGFSAGWNDAGSQNGGNFSPNGMDPSDMAVDSP